MKYQKKLMGANIALILGLGSQVVFGACGVEPGTNGKVYKCTGETVQGQKNYDQLIVETSARGTTAGLNGYGLYLNGGQWNQKDVTITTTGWQADAIKTGGGGGTLNITGKLVIYAQGFSADGINLARDSASSIINVGNDAEITALSGMGVRANTNTSRSDAISLINIGKNATIRTTGVGVNDGDFFGMDLGGLGYAVYAGNANVSGKNEARVTLGDNSKILTEGAEAHAVFANRRGIIQLGSTTIETKEADAHGLYAETGATADGDKGGTIDLLSHTKITTVDGGVAIHANGEGSKIASYNSDTKQNTSGVFVVKGDMKVTNGGVIDLRMMNGSSFVGNTSFGGTKGILDLNLSGADSVWQMSNSSDLTTLDVSNAKVKLGDQSVNVTSSNNVVLTMQDLKGNNGQFYLRTDIVGSGASATNISDMLKVEGTSTGKHTLHVNDQKTGSAVGTEEVRVAEIKDGNAKFVLANGSVDIGAFKYRLSERDPALGTDRHWYLSTKGGTIDPPITDPADRSVNILNINYLLSNVENQTLLQRMGELRRGEKGGDVWVKGFAGQLDSFGDKRIQKFDMDYSGVQMGADKLLSQDSGRIYIGGMMGTSKAKAHYKVGNGDTESYHIGAYATYKTDNDFYVDGILKYVHMRNKFNTKTSGGFAVKGKGNTNGYSLGVETGKRFYFDKEIRSNWYIEPQGQLTYSRQNSTTISASNGLKTDLNSFNSLIGRASVIAGYRFENDKNPIDVYFKTGYVKEFDGKTGYTFNKAHKESYKFNGNWWDNGIGINAQINNRHNLYLDANYSAGNKFDKKEVNLGYRYNF